MNWRMIKAEWLKLRKRRGLFWWALGLAVGVVTLIFGVIEVLHLSNAAQHGPAGGLTGITRGLTGLYAEGGCGRNHCRRLRRHRRRLGRSLPRSRCDWSLAVGAFRSPVARGPDLLHSDNHPRVCRCGGVHGGLSRVGTGCQRVRDRSWIRLGTAGHRVRSRHRAGVLVLHKLASRDYRGPDRLAVHRVSTASASLLAGVGKATDLQQRPNPSEPVSCPGGSWVKIGNTQRGRRCRRPPCLGGSHACCRVLADRNA